jgi:hypothetical protein
MAKGGGCGGLLVGWWWESQYIALFKNSTRMQLMQLIFTDRKKWN